MVARPPLRRLLILAAAALVGLVAVGAVLWLLSGLAGAHHSAAGTGRQATATVLRSASCQGQDAYDTIGVPVAGHQQQLRLNGCGYPRGQRLTVLVPPSVSANAVVDLAAAPTGDASGLAHRIAFLLLLVSTVAGGGCAYLVHRRRKGRPAVGLAAVMTGGFSAGTPIGGDRGTT